MLKAFETCHINERLSLQAERDAGEGEGGKFSECRIQESLLRHARSLRAFTANRSSRRHRSEVKDHQSINKASTVSESED